MKIFITKVTVLVTILFIPAVSFAAEVFFESKNSSVNLGQDFTVEVLFNTEDKKINAVEGVLDFPSDLLELKEIRDGNSSINFWIEKPQIKGKGEVVFSGITAGGFSGKERVIFNLVFTPKKSGAGTISFTSFQALENNGLGTKVPLTRRTLDFNISNSVEGFKPDVEYKDQNPPESFELLLGNDPEIFNGEHFIAFSTVDKGSGVDHYEVKESYWWGFGGEYIEAESPHLLKNQSLKRHIYVKAVDKEGNESVAKLSPQNKVLWLEQALILGIIIAICFLLLRIVLKRKHR